MPVIAFASEGSVRATVQRKKEVARKRGLNTGYHAQWIEVLIAVEMRLEDDTGLSHTSTSTVQAFSNL